MDSISLAHGHAVAHPSTPPDLKLARAGQEFEAVLLESLLRPLEQTFGSLPGKSFMAGGDTYGALGTQALATGLAQSGGLGIARLALANLQKSNGLHNP